MIGNGKTPKRKHLGKLSILPLALMACPLLVSADDMMAMNGYRLEDYKNFLEDWHFVTVRYRKDSGEMRFTYANDKAWKALQAGGTHYPDGAAFAKFSAITEEDPAFVSSAVPSGVRRYQLMVKDKQKHSETEGWGYALFLSNGMPTREDHVITTAACHACHAMVPDRQYVFSQPINFGLEDLSFVGTRRPSAGLPKEVEERLTYTTEDVKALPVAAQSRVGTKASQVRLLRGPMEKNAFSGTLDEIRPSLAREAIKSGLPAALVVRGGELFSLVRADKDTESCSAAKGYKGVPMISFSSVASFQAQAMGGPPDENPKWIVLPHKFCHSAPENE